MPPGPVSFPVTEPAAGYLSLPTIRFPPSPIARRPLPFQWNPEDARGIRSLSPVRPPELLSRPWRSRWPPLNQLNSRSKGCLGSARPLRSAPGPNQTALPVVSPSYSRAIFFSSSLRGDSCSHVSRTPTGLFTDFSASFYMQRKVPFFLRNRPMRPLLFSRNHPES